MVATKFGLKYSSNVGFATDQGGRGFQLPAHIAMRKDKKIFVASRGRGPTVGVQMVSREFEFYGKIGSQGKADGQMLEPSAIAFDSDQNMYVSDEKLDRITRFDPEGKLIDSWGVSGDQPGELSRPTGLLIVDDVVYVTDAMNHRIQRHHTDGRYIDQLNSGENLDSQLHYPWGITSGIKDDIYVADWGNDRIVRFGIDGEVISTLSKGIGAELALSRPADVAIDFDGNVYVADWGNQIFQVFDENNKFLYMNRGEADLNPWALEYFESQQDEKRARSSYVPVFDTDTEDVREISARIEPYFWDPCSIMVDEAGRVYVLETCRHRFQIFERI
ncbi:MAG: NHL repeat-containing protein [Chloroflexota bacterium]|nr:NHL repeat-containing protein [Chloroflexota bacterium]